MKVLGKIIYLVSALFLFQSASAINVRYIKGTFTILKPEYKQLSPIHGFIWWGKMLAENNYKYAGDSLTKYLFHVPHAQAGVEEFVITDSEFYPITYFSAKTIGRMIGAIEKMRPGIIEAQKRITGVTQKKAPQKGQLSAKQIASAKEIKKLADDLKKELTSVLSDDKDYQVRLQNYFQSLPAQNQAVNKSKLNTTQGKMLTAVIESLKASGFFELMDDIHNPLYVPYQTYNLFFAYLIRKAQDVRDGVNIGKADFKSYFDGLFEQLGEGIFTQEGLQQISSEAWLVDAFDNEKDVLQEVEAAISNAPKLDLSFVDQYYEKMIYAEFSRPSGLPKIAAYINDADFLNKKFTNCADNLARNLCNIALFNEVRNQFSFEEIPTAAPDAKGRKFYAQFNDPARIEAIATHNAWNQEIQNQPYVAYERIFDLKNPEIRANVGDTKGLKGFLLQTPALKPPLFGKKLSVILKDGTSKDFPVINIRDMPFALINPEEYAAYEVEPTLTNMIVIMNSILGLELYKDIGAAFLEPNFNATYFAALADRLGWEFPSDLDLNSEKLAFPIKTNGGQFDMRLSWGHGEVIVRNQSKIKEYQVKIFNFASKELLFLAQQNQLIHHSYVANLFALYQIFSEIELQAFVNYFESIKSLRYLLYYSQLLRSSHEKNEVIKSIIQKRDRDFYPLCGALIDKLDIGADLYYLKEIAQIDFKGIDDKSILDSLGKKYDEMLQKWMQFPELAVAVADVANLFFNQGLFIEKAPGLAQNLCDRGYKLYGLPLFAKLVEKGKAFDQAEAEASKGMSSSDFRVAQEALKVFSNLIKRHVAIDSAIHAAQVGVESSLVFVPSLAMQLWDELLKGGQGYDQAEAFAAKLVQGKIAQALELYAKIVNQGRGYKNAEHVASQTMQDTKQQAGVKQLIIDLLKALVIKGQAYNLAQEALSSFQKLDMSSSGGKDMHKQLLLAILELAEELAKKGISLDQVFQIALQGIQKGVLLQKIAALHVFQVLIEQGSHVDSIIDVVYQILEKGDQSIQLTPHALQIFQMLVQQGFVKSYPLAFKVAHQYSKFDQGALDIYTELVDKEYKDAYNDAVDAARAHEQDEFELLKEAAHRLLNKLRDKGVLNPAP